MRGSHVQGGGAAATHLVLLPTIPAAPAALIAENQLIRTGTALVLRLIHVEPEGWHRLKPPSAWFVDLTQDLTAVFPRIIPLRFLQHQLDSETWYRSEEPPAWLAMPGEQPSAAAIRGATRKWKAMSCQLSDGSSLLTDCSFAFNRQRAQSLRRVARELKLPLRYIENALKCAWLAGLTRYSEPPHAFTPEEDRDAIHALACVGGWLLPPAHS